MRMSKGYPPAETQAEEPAEFYFQYRIVHDRPGLLGDIASLLGMLGFNIMRLANVSDESRGFLLETRRLADAELLRTIVENLRDIEVAALRRPTLRDRIALRHGKFIERADEEMRTYRFVRDELGVLVDFVGELLKRPGRQVIGMRGQPRVGKTESIVAASVYANKRWTFVSSTLLRQTMLKELPDEQFLSDNFVYMIDGAVTALRGEESHWRVVDDILGMAAPIVIEHPDIFVKHTRYDWSLFDMVVELRRDPDEMIQFEVYEQEAARWHE